jgi:hypothetical protein
VIVLRVNPSAITPHPFLKDKGKRINDKPGKRFLAAPVIAAYYKICGILAICPVSDKGICKGLL